VDSTLRCLRSRTANPRHTRVTIIIPDHMEEKHTHHHLTTHSMAKRYMNTPGFTWTKHQVRIPPQPIGAGVEGSRNSKTELA
jgi:hypothetical protein